ncbi:MAG: helix-turn-helix domain-containing protein [Endozoicomonas sp.]
MDDSEQQQKIQCLQGALLKLAILRRGFTQKSFSKALPCAESTASKWCLGTNPIERRKMFKIREILCLPESYFEDPEATVDRLLAGDGYFGKTTTDVDDTVTVIFPNKRSVSFHLPQNKIKDLGSLVFALLSDPDDDDR